MKIKKIIFLLLVFCCLILIPFCLCKKSDKVNIIKIFIDVNSNSYTPHLVKYIIDSIPTNNYITKNKNEANIIVFHITNPDEFVKNKINIVISGESYQLNNKVDLCIGPILKQNCKYNIYYPQFYSSLFEHKKSLNKNDYIAEKTKFCAFMYNAEHEHREHYFDLLSKYKRVDGLGKSRKNTDIPISRHIYNENETYNDIAVDTYKNYKFVLAIENGDIDGYNTEKIINPMIANSIPIYWGNKKIFNIINKKRVIYIPDYSEQELLDVIKRIDNDDVEYNKIINEKWYVDETKMPENVEKELQKEIADKIKNILMN